MGHRELQSQVENEEEENQRRETLMQADIESKEQRRLQEEFLSKLEKVVTLDGFEYYVDRSSKNDGGDNCLFTSD